MHKCICTPVMLVCTNHYSKRKLRLIINRYIFYSSLSSIVIDYSTTFAESLALLEILTLDVANIKQKYDY